jgi:hypothetical protein
MYLAASEFWGHLVRTAGYSEVVVIDLKFN